MVQPTLIQAIARAIAGIRFCAKIDGHPYTDVWADRLDRYADMLPSGGGFDAGTSLLFDASTPTEIAFASSYHCMNDAGYYCGWISVTIIVTPTFEDFAVAVRLDGAPDDPEYNEESLIDYIGDVFHVALGERV